MTYGILKYGSPELRRKSRKVEKVTAEIRRLAEDMLRTMRESNGLGLAAEQVGRAEAVCVIDVPENLQSDTGAPDPEVPMPLVLINPEITAFEGEQTGQEGCLSFPEIYINLKRARTVEVSYVDLAGKPASVRVSGLAARAVQHELDHLNAVLLVDRMSPVQKVALAGKLKRLKKETKAATVADRRA